MAWCFCLSRGLNPQSTTLAFREEVDNERQEGESIVLVTDNTAQDSGLVAQVRAELYKLLALCFYEPTRELAKDIAQGSLASALRTLLESVEVGGWEEGLASIERCREQPADQDAESLYSSLKEEYTRLFIGPGHLPAPPYESIYRQDVPEIDRGLVMGRAAVDARRRYAEAGLQLSPDFTDLPDHIAVELEFMYFLCAKEAEAWQAEDGEEAPRRQSAQRVFLGAHLAKWVPAFCQAVIQAAQVEFYRGLARLTQAYVEGECTQVSIVASLADGSAVLIGSSAYT